MKPEGCVFKDREGQERERERPVGSASSGFDCYGLQTLAAMEPDWRDVEKQITPTLTKALAELCKARPADPVTFLAEKLQELKPSKPAEKPGSQAKRDAIATLTDPHTGKGLVLEEGEQLRKCYRCSKLYTTFSGKTLCIACRREFEDDVEDDEELRGCVVCGKGRQML